LSRIAACLQALKNNNRKALIPYIVAGDPNPAFTVPMMHQLVKQGADIIELGIPFSDPMSEGPVIQLAHERALEFNVSLTSAMAMVSEFRQQDQLTPIVLMGYANPVLRMGFETFAREAKEAGVDGLLTVDMPPEEAHQLNDALKKFELDSIFLIAPTTAPERIKSITDSATGYLYYVSLKGVTGAGNLDIDSVKSKLALIKSMTDLPVAVGFGIKDAESALAVSRLTEGVVVGSALVQLAADSHANDSENAIVLASQIIAEMRSAMDAG
jgi:tryptophan synthase alpha chain